MQFPGVGDSQYLIGKAYMVDRDPPKLNNF